MSPIIHNKNGFSTLRLLSLLAAGALIWSFWYGITEPNYVQFSITIATSSLVALGILKVIRWLFRD